MVCINLFINKLKSYHMKLVPMNKSIISGENIPRGDNNEKEQLS